MLRSRRFHAVIMVALLAAPVFLFGDRALAIQDSEDKVWFGPIGIGVGQGARVFTRLATGGSAMGVRRADLQPARRGGAGAQFQVAPGAIGSFGSTSRRQRIPHRPVGPPDNAGRDCGIQSAAGSARQVCRDAEVYSQLTGHTSLLLGGPDCCRRLSRHAAGFRS
jgi:hypothetical protein